MLVVWDRPGDFHDLLEQRFPHVNFEYAASVAEVCAALARIDPQIVFSTKHQRLPTESHRLAAGHPGVRWVQVGGSGYDHLSGVDLSRVVLTNATGVLAPFLAETVTGMMLAWNGHLFRYRAQQRRSEWRPIPFTPLRGRTLLVIGMGAIGTGVARNARSLGMRVLGASRAGGPGGDADAMYRLDDLDAALSEADYVSVHLRLNDDTRHFLDAAKLASMKPEAFLINTARGPVVEEAALIDALRNGRLSGAYLDVFDEEPLPAGHPFWQMENVLVTPHAADGVADWPRRFAAFFADNLDRWINREPLLNRVSTNIQESKIIT